MAGTTRPAIALGALLALLGWCLDASVLLPAAEAQRAAPPRPSAPMAGGGSGNVPGAGGNAGGGKPTSPPGGGGKPTRTAGGFLAPR